MAQVMHAVTHTLEMTFACKTWFVTPTIDPSSYWVECSADSSCQQQFTPKLQVVYGNSNRIVSIIDDMAESISLSGQNDFYTG